MPAGLDYAVFDLAVNLGVARAASTLQRIVGAKVYGVTDGHPRNDPPGQHQVRHQHSKWTGVKPSRTLPIFGEYGAGWRRYLIDSMGMDQRKAAAGQKAGEQQELVDAFAEARDGDQSLRNGRSLRVDDLGLDDEGWGNMWNMRSWRG